MPLTNTAVRNAKSSGKTIKLFDERGLYLEVSPTGGKWWRQKVRVDGKEKRLSAWDTSLSSPCSSLDATPKFPNSAN